MTSKISHTTMNSADSAEMPGQGERGHEDFAAQWNEALLVYPLYAAVATQFSLAPLPHPAGELPPARPTRATFDSDLKWLGEMDGKVLAFQIRQLSPQVLNASELGLCALVRRQLRKPDKTDADRDKIDFLLVQYFAMRASGDLVRKEITLDDVARTLQPVLVEVDATPLEWCEPLDQILEKIKKCHSLRDMMEEGLVEQARLLKDAAGCMFYDPAALVAFCRFNFLLRRAFIRMLHADLNAVQAAIHSLESRGINTVDCRGAGFSAAERTVELRYFCENWRQPYQKDYTQSSVRRAFEQLLALRADLEEALKNKQSAVDSVLPSAPDAGNAAEAGPEESNMEFMDASSLTIGSVAPPEPEIQEEELPAEEAPSGTNESALRRQAAPVAPTAAAEAEKCLEAIWEQLIAVPPSRGRSMSTVVLQDTKVLLSSWEVAAFVSEGGQESEDLRRAVVARALLALASDKRKRSGDESALASALMLARTEVSYFQGRVEQAKRAKKTEAAVNLGISTKRLLSTIEESEKLQP